MKPQYSGEISEFGWAKSGLDWAVQAAWAKSGLGWASPAARLGEAGLSWPGGQTGLGWAGLSKLSEPWQGRVK